jgi:alkylation response protein AidB-like acyl-CoA dehydrogenase
VISFGPTEEQEIVRDTMKEFAQQAMRPIARDSDEAASIPQDFFDSVWELGLTSTQLPEEHGGGGEPRAPVTNAILLEELGYGDATLAVAAMVPSGFANAVADYGTRDQKERLLPLFCQPTFHAASLAVVEPGAVFDAVKPRTRAEPKGDAFVVSGVKSFVPLGDRASHFLVVARNGERLDAFIVPREAEGLTISEPEKNLGLRGLTTVSLELERVEVPQADRLGGKEGCDVRNLLASSRAALSAVMVGLSRGVLADCIPYAKDRVAFGEAIAKKQSIAFRLAEMHIEIEAMRWLTWKAASFVENRLDATKSAHLARCYVAEKCMWVADNGVQIYGGHGYIRDNPLEMWFRNARTLGVLEGTIGV